MQGGDMIQLEKLQAALIKKGVEVDFSEQQLYTPAIGLGLYDIVHLWNFSMPWTKLQLWAAAKHKVKTVCSMIYHEKDDFVSYPNQQIMWDYLDVPVFLAEEELERVKRHIDIKDKKIFYIPNGIDEFFFDYPKKKRNYILTVGRLEDFKGQLTVAKACQNLGLRYVVCGELNNYPGADLYKAMLEEVGAEIWEKRSQKELVDVYAGAKLFVLASRAEIFPLSVMEAGAQALNIVLTDHCSWKDIPNVEWCEFNNVKSIEKAIIKSLKKSPNIEFQEKLKGMTWEKIADQYIKIYKKLIKEKNAL